MDKTFCVLGDSVVQAAYVKISWVDLMKIFLELRHRNDFINLFHLGVGGNTANDILQRLESELSARGATSIIVGVGVNDSGYFKAPSKPIVEKERFVNNLEKIIRISKKLTKDIIFIGLVLGDDSLLQPFPESSQGKSYTAERVKEYDGLLKKTAEVNGCKYIYLFDKLNFRDFQDGLHPNDNGHNKMFEEIKKYF